MASLPLKLNLTDHPEVDQDLIDSFNRYLIDGIPFGSFLEAVVCNQLFQAWQRADWRNSERLKEICQFIYSEFPAGSHGSIQNYTAWLDNKAELRAAKREDE